MSFLDLRNRLPTVERLPDLRLRVTRKYDALPAAVKTPAEILALAWLPWGTIDEKYTDTRLIKQDVAGQEPLGDSKQSPESRPAVLTRIFEQIDSALETVVGNADVAIGQDGLITVSQNYLQFSTGTAVYGVPGTTLASAPWTQCVLKTESRTDDGTLRRIKRDFINHGLISQSDETRNDGALLLRTLVYVNDVPPTPAGYINISQKVEYPGGLPVRTYAFAKGNGQISLDIEYRLSPDQGTTGCTVYKIKQLSDPSVSSNPISPPASTELIAVTYEDSDGHRIWSATYAHGQGIIASDTVVRNNGRAVVYSITSINAVPSAPSPTLGGSVVLISSSQRNGSRFEDGTIIYDYKWAEGHGLISENIVAKNDGTREVTDISLGTRIQPAQGIVIRDDYHIDAGYTIYTVSVIQSADGSSDPSAVNYTQHKLGSFPMPGRAKSYAKTIGYWTALDVFLSPPVEVPVDFLVTVTYQTSATLGTVGTLWAPSTWATVEASYVGIGNYPKFSMTALRGYRSVDATPISHTFGSLDYNGGTMLGNTCFGGSSGTLTCYGGPVAPDGNTYTMHYSLELAFTETNGTKWYRKTVTSCVAPTQAALPV
jgi:hypothetical protein